MNFREIIIAAIEEISGNIIYIRYQCGACLKWCTPLRGDIELRTYFSKHRRSCEFHWGRKIDGTLFTLYETDLLDPNWSPATLAKRIDDEIARIERCRLKQHG